MGNEIDAVYDDFATELVSTGVDIGTDYSEILLEELLDKTANEIPFVKSILSIGKAGLLIREIFTIKKLLVFLREFHTNTINPEKLDEFITKFDSDLNHRKKITEHLMVMNDRFNVTLKAEILANLFAAHINGRIDWQRFKDLSYCVDSIHPKGLELLPEIAKKDFFVSSEEMVQDKGESQLIISSGIGYESGYVAGELIINDFGKDLFNYGLNKA
jgi:hypothetical protein